MNNRYEVTATTLIGSEASTITRPVATSDEADQLAVTFARNGYLVSIVDLKVLNQSFPTRSVAA